MRGMHIATSKVEIWDKVLSHELKFVHDDFYLYLEGQGNLSRYGA